MGEISLAVRSLLKSKLFTAVALITLTIGIGATTAVFSIVDAVALRPLPFSEPGRLVEIEEWSATELCAGCGVGVSRPMANDIAARTKSFTGLASYSELPVNVGGIDAPERVSAAEVSGNFFTLLGVRPAVGRTLDPNDDRADAPPVVVVSSRYFAGRLGGDSSRIGKTIRINGRPATIVGVMPRDAVLPEFAQLWMPASRTTASTDRAARDVGLIGRLKDGVTLDQADAEVRAIAAGIASAFPETQKDWTARARSLRQATGDDNQPFMLMFAAVMVLWAVICANLAGLVLARGIAKRREIAVRLALGASRGDVMWHLFAESLCLAALGGVLGAIVSSWTTDLLLASLDTAIPSWLTPRLDAGVVAFCILISGLSAAAAGLLPALRASRPNVHDDLKSGGQATVNEGRSTLRGSLVVMQLALSLVLLAVAGVLTATIQSLAGREGNEGAGVVQARVALLGEQSNERIAGAIGAFVERLGALPEARAAAASGSGFIAGFGGHDQKIRVEGVPVIPDGVSPRFYLTVTPRYFETTSMRVVEGRAFDETDRAGSQPVVIIGRRLAQQLWSGRSAVGHRIRLGNDSLPWRTIVGVVAETGDTASRGFRNLAYVPFPQAPAAEATLLVAAKGTPGSIIVPMREAARSVNPDLPLLDLMTSTDAHAQVWRPYKAFALTISGIGAIALTLSAIGLYGIIAYGAQRRTREIGLRIALGARPRDVVKLITGQGMRLVTVGLGLGLVAALAVMPLMRNMMFGLNPMNPVVFAGAAAILLLVAALASYFPARRAAATDPMVALRSD